MKLKTKSKAKVSTHHISSNSPVYYRGGRRGGVTVFQNYNKVKRYRKKRINGRRNVNRNRRRRRY